MSFQIGPLSMDSQDATERLATCIASVLAAGDTLLLSGEIGAGKSTFARALIRARLGRFEDVPSPTFTLVQTYEAPDGDIWHCDLYRLTSPDEVLELGLDDAFEQAICLIEWPDRLGDLAPSSALHVTLAAPQKAEDAAHLITFNGGAGWRPRLESCLD